MPSINVKRITKAQCKKAAKWLQDHGDNVPSSGIKALYMTKERLERMEGTTLVVWVAFDEGKLVGVMWGQSEVRFWLEVKDDQGQVVGQEKKTAWLFSLLAVDHTLLQDQQLQRLLIADTLTVEAHKDIIERGMERDYIWCRGPENSPGARYCRDFLGMKETKGGAMSDFLKPFMEIVDGPHSRGAF